MCARSFLVVLALAAPGSAQAWIDHALGTWQAFAAIREVTSAAPAEVEPLDAFLRAEQARLEQLLRAEEEWARNTVPEYMPRPEALAFKAGAGDATLQQRFLAALRVNPESKLALFLQLRPGADPAGRPVRKPSDVTFLRRLPWMKEIGLVGLAEGERVAALDILASYVDEPDWGLDIGLWEDNGTPWGRRYGFGRQPFGNPALEFSSQAPFHVGLYHESRIIYAAAPFLKRTYPEYRIHLYRSLARYAFASGHAYWGWRFAAWGMHYVQDLTQPYHAALLPGTSVARMLWINALRVLGIPGPVDRAIVLVTNRHLALENYQFEAMRRAYAEGNPADSPAAAARTVPPGAGDPVYTSRSPRGVISAESHAAADEADRVIAASLPQKYVSDPDYLFYETEPGIDLARVLDGSPRAAEAMRQLVAAQFARFGAHSRSYLRSILEPGPKPGAD
jgi:hypothetical protein